MIAPDGQPTIEARSITIADDAVFGPDVVIEAEEVEIGPGARIGLSDDDDFRTPPGVRIRAGRLRLGPGVGIGRAVRIEGGDIELDEAVRVFRHSTIRVTERLAIGAHGTVNESCEIGGRHVDIGQELWMLPTAKIGGGSAFEAQSSLAIGHYVHLGVQTLVNTARPVVIGHEVGLGTRTSIYTHGAYPSRLQGFPVAFDSVSIGDFSWIPGATINPGVRIGRNCVVGVNSLVTASIPDGALAVGSPAKVVREGAYPRPLEPEQRKRFFGDFLAAWAVLLGSTATVRDQPGISLLDTGESVFGGVVADDGGPVVSQMAGPGGFDGRRLLLVADGATEIEIPPAWTVLDPRSRRIRGVADQTSHRFVNELRRYGIRFYSRPRDARYVDWEAAPPAFSGPLDAERIRDR